MRVINDLDDDILELLEIRGSTPEEIDANEKMLRKKILKVFGFIGLSFIMFIILMAQPSISACIGAVIAGIALVVEVIINLIEIYKFLNEEDDR